MLAERYLKRRHAEGKAEGKEEGKKEGREEAHTQWRKWYNHKTEAEAAGRPFDEPPPDED